MRGVRGSPAQAPRLWRTHFAGRFKVQQSDSDLLWWNTTINRASQRSADPGCNHVSGTPGWDAWELTLLFPPNRRQPGGHVTMAFTGGYARFRFPRVNAAKPQRPRQHQSARMLIGESWRYIVTPTHHIVSTLLADWKHSPSNQATTTECQESFHYEGSTCFLTNICYFVLERFIGTEFLKSKP